MSIRNKIFIVIILTAVLPLALIAVTVFPFHRAQLVDRETALLEASVRNRSDRVAQASGSAGREALQQIADQYPSLGESAEVLIFFKDGSGRFEPAVGPRFAATAAAPYEDMQALLAQAFGDGETHHAYVRDQRGTTALAAARRAPGTDYAVIVKMDRAEALRPNDILRNQFLVVSFIAVALAALLALILARAVAAPLLALARTVDTFNTEKPRRIEVLGNDEVASLARKFREMWEGMKDYNAALEQSVWKRTEELAAAKRDLEDSNKALAAQLAELEKLYGMLIDRNQKK
ncbi:MAG TPA: hypothetical protein VL283_01370 [Candidatus Baltobacteraceae bacterium]|nr:hypothetical protein [Candidatus Baltobacteraceae bacterium]